MRRTLAVLAAMGMLGPLFAARRNADAAAEVEEDNSLKSALVTPHTAWAKPLPGKPIRVLFLINDGHGNESYTEPGTRLREAVELMQRLHIDGDAALVTPKGDFYQGAYGLNRTLKLMEKPYDVYVFGGVKYDGFDPEVLYKILEQVVDNGAGLITCGTASKMIFTAKRREKGAPPALWRGLPLGRLAQLAGLAGTTEPDARIATKHIGAYRLGKGRGVQFSYGAHALTPRLTCRWRALTEYDYWMLMLSRAVQWAAGRPADVLVAPMSLSVARDDLARTSMAVELVAAKTLSGVAVALRLRRGDGVVTDLPDQTATLAAGAPNTLSVELPVGLRADDYFLDVTANVDGYMVGAGAGHLNVTSVDGIAEVACDRASIERGEATRVTVRTQGALGQGDVIRVQALDATQRILLQLDQPAQPGETEYHVEAPMGDWATIQVTLEGLLIRDGREVARAETDVLVPKRRRGQFNFVQWAARTDVLEYYSWQKLAEAGWHISVAASAKTAPFDLTAIPYTTRLMENLDKEGMMQPACWNDDAAIDAYIDKIVQKQVRTRDAGTFVYSLGDEGTTKGCCVHPACIEAYRAYLKDQYGAIAKLNASWGESYSSFADVDLLDRKDVTENGAVGQGKYARWYDRQAFSRYNLAMLTQRFVKAFAAFDKHAITGFEGTGGFGDDIDLLLESMPFWSPYPSIGDDIIRSVAARDHIRANWMGYHKNADPLINYSWRMVMKEMDSIWWWRYDGCGSWRGYIRPVLDFWPATAELCEEMRPVREGLGDLLLHSRVRHSGIAIYYSLPTALCGKLGDNAGFPSPKFSHTRWLTSIYSQGLDVRYVTSGAIARGALKNDGYRTIVLCMASAMPTDDVNAIHAFVRDGGTVIADLRPAIMDGHCKPLERGALDDVFGIVRAPLRKAARTKVETITVPGLKAPVSLKGAELRIDTAVSAASAKALASVDGTPVMLVNQFGQGKAILANLEIADPLGDSGPEAPILQVINGLLTDAGITPALRLRAPDGGPLPGFETRVWENGSMTIVGIWQTMAVRFYGEDGIAKSTAGKPVLATLPVDKVVYDLRNGHCLGSVREFRTSVQTGRANFFALLPKELAAPQLQFTSPPAPMQDTVLAIKVPGIADSATFAAVHAEVVAPDGWTPAWGRKPVILKGGTGQFTFRTARNDTPGAWRVRVKELFSKHQSELAWTSTSH